MQIPPPGLSTKRRGEAASDYDNYLNLFFIILLIYLLIMIVLIENILSKRI